MEERPDARAPKVPDVRCVVCPRTFYTDVNRFRLLGAFGEAVFPLAFGV